MEDKVKGTTFNWCDPVEKDFYEMNLTSSVWPSLALQEDIINKPNHYTQGAIEPIDFITANNMDFCAGNVVKYVTRHKYKNGLEDLKKAEFYLKKLIEEYEQ